MEPERRGCLRRLSCQGYLHKAFCARTGRKTVALIGNFATGTVRWSGSDDDTG